MNADELDALIARIVALMIGDAQRLIKVALCEAYALGKRDAFAQSERED